MRKQELTLPRNPILIKIFRILKLAENAGYGFDKMFNGWRSYYNVEPVVENDVAFYKIGFPLKTKWEDVPEKRGQESGLILTKRQREVLEEIRKNLEITREELSKKLKINPSAIQKHIEKLKKRGFLKRVGPTKGGHWEVNKL